MRIEITKTDHKELNLHGDGDHLAEMRAMRSVGWRVESIDDVGVMAFCECCERPIMETETNYGHDCDLCKACADSGMDGDGRVTETGYVMLCQGCGSDVHIPVGAIMPAEVLTCAGCPGGRDDA